MRRRSSKPWRPLQVTGDENSAATRPWLTLPAGLARRT